MFRNYLPLAIRVIAAIDVLIGVIFLIKAIGDEYEAYLTLMSAVSCFVSAVFIYGFASIVEAAEQYLSQFRYNEEDTTEE